VFGIDLQHGDSKTEARNTMSTGQDLDGRKALVTGSATGLGRAMAVKLAERGADLVVNYSRSASEAEEAADLCRAAGAEVHLVQADVAEDADCTRLAEAATGWGQLDILINNAGTTRRAPDHSDLGALSKDDFMDIYAVNVAGAFLVTRACEGLLRAGHAQSGRASAVLNTSSIAGVTGIGSSVAYAASKGALNTLTLSLARALAPAIRVNAVCPGYIDTRWFSDHMEEEKYLALRQSVEAATPLKAASSPEDIADAALFFVSDGARHVTGETLLADAGTHLGFAPLAMR